MTKRYRPRGSGAPTGATPEAPLVLDAPPVPSRPTTARLAPPPSIIRYSPTNQYAELSFPSVVEILREADQGRTERWADLTRRMLESDDHLASVYKTRISAVAGSQWKLHPGDGDPELATRAVDDCRRMLEALPNLERVFSDILDGVFTGFSVLEILWTPRADTWLPSELIWLHPRRFRFSYSYEPYLYDNGLAASYLGAETTASDGISGVRLQANKYIRHLPRELPNYPPSAGLLRACVRAWWVKVWCTKFWLSGAEVAGNPRLWAHHSEAADAAVRQMLYDGLASLSADAVGAFDKETEIRIEAPLAQGSGSVWEALATRCDAAISKAILGSTLNVEIGDTGGAYAAAESQGDITITPRLQSDQRGMWSTIQRDLLRPFLEFNRHRYGGVVPPIPRGESVLYQDQVEIDELIVRKGKVTGDELRMSRGLEPWGPERGGDVPIPAEAESGGFGAFSDAPASSPGGAAAVRPFKQTRKLTAGLAPPWTRALAIAGAAATPTSTRSAVTKKEK